MKVKDLIGRLQALNPDIEVLAGDWHKMFCLDNVKIAQVGEEDQGHGHVLDDLIVGDYYACIMLSD